MDAWGNLATPFNTPGMYRAGGLRRPAGHADNAGTSSRFYSSWLSDATSTKVVFHIWRTKNAAEAASTV